MVVIIPTTKRQKKKERDCSGTIRRQHANMRGNLYEFLLFENTVNMARSPVDGTTQKFQGVIQGNSVHYYDLIDRMVVVTNKASFPIGKMSICLSMKVM